MGQFNGDEEGFFARWTVSILWPEVIAWMESRMAADKAGDLSFHGYHLPRFAFFSTLAVKPFAEFKSKLEAQFYTREQIIKRCGYSEEGMHYFMPGNGVQH